MRLGIAAASLSVIAVTCQVSLATIYRPSIEPVEIPAGTLIFDGGGATLDDYVSQDLYAMTTADWTTAAIVIELTAGSIYQDALGNATGPVGIPVPSLAYDSYVTSPTGFTSIQGAAGDLGDFVFMDDDTTGLSLSWDGGGTDMSNIGSTRIGRFTFSDDAQGTWSLAVTEAHKPLARFENGLIQNGQMHSPATLEGDLNYDGFVGIADLSIVLGDWNHDGAGIINRNADPTGDEFVGIEDLGVVLGNWNAGTPPPQTVPYPWPGGLVGDRTGDGFVGIEDKVNSWWNETVPPATGGDTSGDGFVGLDDQNLLLSNWNNGTPSAAVVPEPATACLLGLLGVMLRRRR